MSARSYLLAAVAAACLAAPAAADDKPDLSSARFGPPLLGSAVAPADLKGHPVVVEFWGVN